MPWFRIPIRRPVPRLIAALIVSVFVLFAISVHAGWRTAHVRADDAASALNESLMGRVAYIAGGDLFLLSAGSAPSKLTSTGDVTSVRWSPGGSRLLITRDRETFALTLDGSSSMQIEGAWAPDDSVVAVAAPTGGIDLLTPADGNRRTLLAGTDNLAFQPIAWSPDGGTLALLRQELNAKGLSASESTWLVQRNGQGLRRLVAAGDTWPRPIGFSPDGRWLAILRGPAELCVSCRADGEQLDIVAVDGSQTFTLGILLRADWLTWMPDSSAVVASVGGGRETYRDKHLATLDLTRGTLSLTATQPDTVEIQPTFSPSGNAIAFTRGAAVEGPLFTNLDAQHGFPDVISRRQVVVRPSGGTERVIAGSAGWAQESPRWAGAQWLLLVRWKSNQDHSPPVAQLWLSDVLTGAETMLTASLGMPESSFGYYGDLGWSALFSWHS